MNARDQLIAWLSDAHAMERGIVDNLKNHAEAAKDFPDLQADLESHLVITERQAADLEDCLNTLGADTSSLKTGMAKLGGLVSGVAGAVASDTVVKNLLADYSTEHFEIACYESLITAARDLGETPVVGLCERILGEEKAMANLLEERIAKVTSQYVTTLTYNTGA